MSEHEERRKPGTRPKGARRAITVRVPTDQWDVYEATRQSLGYKSLSDFVAALLAKHHQLAVPDYALYADEALVAPAGDGYEQPMLLKAG